MTCEDLEQSLRRLPSKDLVVRVGHPEIYRGILGVIASPDFERVKPQARQRGVWDHLFAEFGDVADRDVQFVYVFSARELAEADALEAAYMRRTA
jgi:hypothetical protein